jgi:thiol-disulfide isomerase/thioredoxin
MSGRIFAAAAVAGALMAVAFVARGGGGAAAPARTFEMSGVLEDMNGGKVDLAAFAGKPVVINLWATWCGPCRLETPQLVSLSEKFKSRGVTILGISVDDMPDAVRAFAAEFKVSYPMLVGVGHEDILRRIGYQDVLPFSILVDKNGLVVGEITGLETTADWERRIEELLK